MRKPYLSKLDAVRGIAILGVFLFHSYVQTFDVANFNWEFIQAGLTEEQGLTFYLFYLFSYGWVGVPIFFVLSGFVNHWSFLNNSRFKTQKFLVRRFWRIYPPYLAALLYFAFVYNGGLIRTQGVGDFLAHLFLVHNFNEDYIFGFNNSFWSIAVEVQFYLLYPLVLNLRKRIGMKQTLLLTLALSVLIRLLAAITLGNPAIDNFYISEFTLFSWFHWILGAYLAEQYYYEKPAFRLSSAQLAGLFALFIACSSFKLTFSLSSSLAALITAILMERYITSDYLLPKFVSVWLTPLGLCSYSFYLWHEPFLNKTLLFLQQAGLPNHPFVSLSLGNLIIFSLFFAASWVLYKTIENWGVVFGKQLRRANA